VRVVTDAFGPDPEDALWRLNRNELDAAAQRHGRVSSHEQRVTIGVQGYQAVGPEHMSALAPKGLLASSSGSLRTTRLIRRALGGR